MPSIVAENRQGAYYGLGYVHAQDRLWQLSLRRFASQGKLCSFVGIMAIKLDIFWTSLELYEWAGKIEKNLEPEVKQAFQAYADGINDFVKSLQVMPLQFYALGLNFQPWTVRDSLTFYIMMSFSLNYNYYLQPIRTQLAGIYTQKIADYILPSRSDALLEDIPIINEQELKKMGLFDEKFANFILNLNQNSGGIESDQQIQETVDQILDNVDIVPDFTGHGGAGSNSWVIDGKFTQSGYPLLANDPHLDATMPCAWYLSELIYPGHNILGASLAGGPLTLVGRNEYVSWSTTILYSDTSDLFLEKILSQDKYEVDGKPRNLTIVRKQINVKGQDKPFEFDLRKTHHGPLLENIVNSFHPNGMERMQHHVALAWSGFDENDNSNNHLFKMAESKNLTQFQYHQERINGAAIAVLFATTDKHIGFRATGRNPVRKNPVSGVYITDGSKSVNDWNGFLDFTKNAHLNDPEKGYIVANNNKFAHDGYLNGVSLVTTPTARANRANKLIQTMLQENSQQKLTVQDMVKMQLDVKDAFAEQMLQKITRLIKENLNMTQESEVAKRFLFVLETWNQQFFQESVGASVYWLWERNFQESFFHMGSSKGQLQDDELKTVHGLYIFDNFVFKFVEQLDTQRQKLSQYNHPIYQKEFCLTEHNQNYSNPCVFNMIDSLVRAGKTLLDRFGDNPYDWQYGQVHLYVMPHLPFSNTPLKPYFERQIRAPGSKNTLNVHIPQYDDAENFEGKLWSANLRVIFDMQPGNPNYLILDSGISQRSYSKHYDDMQSLHSKGEYIEVKMGVEQFKNQTQFKLQTLIYDQNSKNDL